MNILERIFSGSISNAVKAVIQRPPWFDYLLSAQTNRSEFANTPEGWLRAATYNVWARNCINAQANAIAPIPLKLYDKDDHEIESHPILDLLANVNDVFDDQLTFRRGIVQSRQIFGRSLILKTYGTKGIVELFRLPVQSLKLVPSATEYIIGWQDKRNQFVYPRASVIDIVKHSADGSPDADSPTAAAIEYINSFTVANVASRAIDKRGGQMGGIVAYDATILNTDQERMATSWDKRRNDPENAGKDLHMPQGTTYTTGAFSAVQMQREQRMARLGKEIMGIYGVPPAIAGDYSDASVLANATIQDKAFWQYWGLAELGAIEEALNYQLLWREYPGAKEAGLYLGHDTSGIISLQEDTSTRGERSTFLFAAKIISLNEARDMSGFDAIDNPAADSVEFVTLPGEVVSQTNEAQKHDNITMSEPAQSVAGKATYMPVIDFVGMTASDLSGRTLGAIDKIQRFGVHDGITATKAQPVVMISGTAYSARDIRVAVKADPMPMMAVAAPAPPVDDMQQIHIHLPESFTTKMADMPAPIINVAAPMVNVTNEVAAQPAPIVNVAAPSVSVAAPNVTVTNDAPVINIPPVAQIAPVPLAVREDQIVERDRNGNIVSTMTTITYEAK